MRSMVEGFPPTMSVSPETSVNPSTTLRVVPLPLWGRMKERIKRRHHVDEPSLARLASRQARRQIGPNRGRIASLQGWNPRI